MDQESDEGISRTDRVHEQESVTILHHLAEIEQSDVRRRSELCVLVVDFRFDFTRVRGSGRTAPEMTFQRGQEHRRKSNRR